jgi:acetyltransferase (GNAT) family protein
MNSLMARRATEVNGPQIAQVSAIYEDAFPAHLRVPFAELAQCGPRDALHVGLDGDAPVGFAAVKLLDPAGWVFLRYFAVDSARRRQRLGQRLWRLLRDSVAADGWPERMCFEVEHPAADDIGEHDRAVREGRVSFWRSCGTVPLAVPGYVMPDITGAGGSEPMLLMAPAATAARTDASGLAALVLAIYTQRYGLSPRDPMVRRAAASIAT